MGVLNIKEIEMPEFAEDDRLSSWAPQAQRTLCWGEGRLPWQGKAEEKVSKPEAVENTALKG